MIEVALRRRTVAQAAELLAIPVETVVPLLTTALHAFRARLADAA